MLRQWLAALFGTFVGFSVLYNFAPVVVADYIDSHTAQTVESFSVEKADCKLYIQVVTHCALKLRDLGNAQAEAITLSHIYLGRVGDKPIVPVALGVGPQRLSVNAGIEHLGGRIAAMLLVAVVAFASLLGCATMADARG